MGNRRVKMGNNHLDSCGILSQESTYSTNTSLRLQCRWGFHISIARSHAVGNVCPPIPPPLQGYSVTIIKLRPTSKWSLQIWRIIRDLGCGAQPQTLSHPLAMYGPPLAPPPFYPIKNAPHALYTALSSVTHLTFTMC